MKMHPWIGRDAPADGAGVRIFCFPYAGAGASCYRRLAKLLPPAEVLAVQLPGREGRLEEPPISAMDALVDAIVDGIHPHVRGRSVFLGYSLGALVAFEVARALQLGARPIDRLIVCASGGPPSVSRRRAARGVDETLEGPSNDARLIARLRELGQTPSRLLEDAEAMRVLLPAVRADFRVLDDYHYVPGPRLRCPVYAIGGDQDSTVPFADLDAWRGCTTGRFEATQVRGDHFFLHNAPEVLAQHVRRIVADKQSATACPQPRIA